MICQLSSKAWLALICVIRWSRAVMVPPEVKMAMLCLGSACSRMRCKPACTRPTKPSQLPSSGVSWLPPTQRPMSKANRRWNCARLCVALRRISSASGSSGSNAGNKARMTASASNSSKALSISSTGISRPAACSWARAWLAVSCWRRRSPARQRSKRKPSCAR
ncbi:hypothetical protein D3C85_991070 [compost metagenome]